MNRFIKSFNIISFGFLLLILSTRVVGAQVVINEVSPASNPEWAEIYNTSEEEELLTDYTIYFHDDLGTQNLEFCENDFIAGHSFRLIILSSNWLNNSGDLITLKKKDVVVDSISYGSGGELGSISNSQSGKRDPDGSGSWTISDSPSQNGSEVNFDCPSSTPVPTSTLTNTNTPAPTAVSSATLKVKEVKNEDGEILSSVKIYIDYVYTHH